MNKTINKSTDLFKVTRNKLNGNYMVHSDHENLIDCFYFNHKTIAEQCKNELNKKVLKQAKQFNFKIK